MRDFYKNKKILITGGKCCLGSRLAITLNQMGAKVYGISLEPKTSTSLFKFNKIEEKIKQEYINICDFKLLSKAIKDFTR